MTKERAIEKLSAECTKCTVLSDPELLEAMHIGIEGLYMCKRAVEFAWPHWPKLLKGETEIDYSHQSFTDNKATLKTG